MRRLLLMLFIALCVSTGYALTVYQNDYEDQTPGTPFDEGGPWNWSDNGGFHEATYQDYNGNIVVEHYGGYDNTEGTEAVDARFGTKWTIAVSGNTSADPADYTISFDLRNVSGGLDPIPLEFFVLTGEGNGVGLGSGTSDYAIADEWVHVEMSLADLTVGWWNGTDWDLTSSPTWQIEVGGPGWPGTSVAAGESWEQTWLFDNFRIKMGSETEPYDPNYVPLPNEDDTVGFLFGTFARFKLAWMAAGDPNTQHEPPYPVNPDVLKHYVYLSNGGETDPNVYYLAAVDQVHNVDPYLTSGYNTYPTGATAWLNKKADTTYYWQIEEGMDDGTGNAYGPGDPNNIVGPLWSFKTISITPYIVTHPKNAVADASGNASFSAKGSASANYYRWYKVVGEVDSAENGETDDVEMAEGALPSTKITTLNITGATTLADEAQFYCIVYFGNPDTTGVPSDPSNAAWLWIPRLMGYWKFDGDMTDSVGDEVPGALTHDAYMKTGDPNFVTATGDSAMVGTDAFRIFSDGQFALLPDADYFNFYQGGFTVSFWYKAYAPAPPGNVFLSKFDAGTGGWLFRSFDGADSSGEFIVENLDSVGYDTLPDNQWNMLTATYDPATTTVRTYTNGEMTNEAAIDMASQNAPVGPVEIGGEDSFGEDVTGDIAIDELKMYSYPMTTEDIAQEYLDISGAEWVCNYELYDLVYDFDGNCRVDLADFALFAATWLDDYRIYPD